MFAEAQFDLKVQPHKTCPIPLLHSATFESIPFVDFVLHLNRLLCVHQSMVIKKFNQSESAQKIHASED